MFLYHLLFSLQAYTHIINGQILDANIICRSCPTKMTIYVPIDNNLWKAWVLLQQAHNHPIHPKIKPSFEDCQKLEEAIHASGSLEDLMVQKLIKGM